METRHGWVSSPPGGHPPSDRLAGVAGLLGLALSLACALVSLICTVRASHLVRSSAHGVTTPAVGVETLAMGIAGLVAAWLAVLLLAGAAEALPRHRLAPVRALTGRIAPQLAPRVAAGLIASVVVASSAGAAQAHPGVTLGGPTDGPASAPATGSPGILSATDPEPVPGEVRVTTTGTAVDAVSPTGTPPAPEPGWRPTSSPARPSTGASAIELVSRGSAAPDTVVVRAGDTLWDLAARHLGPEADAAAIATAWPRWHAANREAIGADPHLLLPGTVLVPPAPESARVAS